MKAPGPVMVKISVPFSERQARARQTGHAAPDRVR